MASPVDRLAGSCHARAGMASPADRWSLVSSRVHSPGSLRSAPGTTARFQRMFGLGFPPSSFPPSGFPLRPAACLPLALSACHLRLPLSRVLAPGCVCGPVAGTARLHLRPEDKQAPFGGSNVRSIVAVSQQKVHRFPAQLSQTPTVVADWLTRATHPVHIAARTVAVAAVRGRFSPLARGSCVHSSAPVRGARLLGSLVGGGITSRTLAPPFPAPLPPGRQRPGDSGDRHLAGRCATRALSASGRTSRGTFCALNTMQPNHQLSATFC